MKTIAFFNNKKGVGTTTLVYHLAWMYADLGFSVLAADLDPQADLSTACLETDRLEELWPDGDHPRSILGAVSPILRGLEDVPESHVEQVTANLGLLVGDLGLSRFEARLSAAWLDRSDPDEPRFRAQCALRRAVLAAAERQAADLALIDIGSNLSAVNRAAITAADFVVLPLAPDLFSLQALRNAGSTLREWAAWHDRPKSRVDRPDRALPVSAISPVGYVVLRHTMQPGPAVRAYQKWTERIPAVYRKEVLDLPGRGASSTEDDTECLATLKHYLSLMAMAHEARKPMFHLRAADGALGGHIYAVQDCYADFKSLAASIAARCGVNQSADAEP